MRWIDKLLGRDQQPSTAHCECGCESYLDHVRAELGLSADMPIQQVAEFAARSRAIEVFEHNMKEALGKGHLWPSPGHYGLFAQVTWALNRYFDLQQGEAGVKPSFPELLATPGLMDDYADRVRGLMAPALDEAAAIIGQLEDPLQASPAELADQARLRAARAGAAGGDQR